MSLKIENAKLLGVVLTVLSICVCMKGEKHYIIIGIVAAFIHSILIFGAITRNTKAIVLWMILAILNLLIMIFTFMVFLGHLTTQTEDDYEEKTGIEKWKNAGIIIGFYVIYLGAIMLIIWTFIVAIGTRARILEEKHNQESTKGQSNESMIGTQVRYDDC